MKTTEGCSSENTLANDNAWLLYRLNSTVTTQLHSCTLSTEWAIEGPMKCSDMSGLAERSVSAPKKSHKLEEVRWGTQRFAVPGGPLGYGASCCPGCEPVSTSPRAGNQGNVRCGAGGWGSDRRALWRWMPPRRSGLTHNPPHARFRLKIWHLYCTVSFWEHNRAENPLPFLKKQIFILINI